MCNRLNLAPAAVEGDNFEGHGGPVEAVEPERSLHQRLKR